MTDVSELSNPNRRRYFLFLCRQVRIDKPSKHIRKSYERVAELLHQEAFYAARGIDNDWNRANDAYQLRRSYICQHPETNEDLRGPISVLEMMVALAKRCEEQIMKSLDGKDRTSEWFNVMMDSLGLLDLDDDTPVDHLSEIVGSTIERALMRDYDADGRGGFWACHRPIKDMRNMEIWFQMMQYLNERMGYL